MTLKLHVGTYAVAYSSGKGNEGERMSIDGVFRKPAIRVKSLRVRKVLRIHVDYGRHDKGSHTFWNCETTCKPEGHLLLFP